MGELPYGAPSEGLMGQLPREPMDMAYQGPMFGQGTNDGAMYSHGTDDGITYSWGANDGVIYTQGTGDGAMYSQDADNGVGGYQFGTQQSPGTGEFPSDNLQEQPGMGGYPPEVSQPMSPPSPRRRGFGSFGDGSFGGQEFNFEM